MAFNGRGTFFTDEDVLYLLETVYIAQYSKVLVNFELLNRLRYMTYSAGMTVYGNSKFRDINISGDRFASA